MTNVYCVWVSNTYGITRYIIVCKYCIDSCVSSIDIH
jgi:hypothetical protein